MACLRREQVETLAWENTCLRVKIKTSRQGRN
nr:MAG TPA: hypothetical protein [Caudoviricetes sp.]DAH61663.1 MAG TPA: hypothetical protein [Caudoviricetes sp.]DAZ51346.1 MAG TPA: hypothetical protein [Caudoviricetes sp.]